MATQAESLGLAGRTAAATRLLHVCIGAGSISVDIRVEEAGRGLRALHGRHDDDQLPPDMIELLKRLD